MLTKPTLVKLASPGWELCDSFGPGRKTQALFSQTFSKKTVFLEELLGIISQALPQALKDKEHEDEGQHCS